MRKILTFFIIHCSFFIFQRADAQSNIALLVPDSLKTNAHAVMRLYEETFIVKHSALATHKYHYITTVLDQKGQDNAVVSVFHDKHFKINDMEAVIYEALGKQVKKMKRSDIVDVNYVSSGSLFDDNKIKYADLKYANYPYTIEVSYEISTTNLLFYPSFFPQSSGTSVEKAQLEIIIPTDLNLRYRPFNGMSAPTITEPTAGQKSYLWQVSGLPVKAPEELSTEYASRGVGVKTAPDNFGLENLQGSMKTWKDLGLFHYNLNKDRDILPENVVSEVKQLIANEKEVTKKIQKIYEYVQAHTRYISIQLGIGGWQTFEAKTVAEKGYGDCKALSNYTKSLLKAVGITAYQALVNADEPDIYADFPMSNFNHVILCVPTPKDSIWLECTSQTQAFGYLGDFTGDRNVLLLTSDGGRLVRTPKYQYSDNQQYRNIELKLTEEGDATASVRTQYSGLQQDLRSQVMAQLSPPDQKEWLYKRLKISGIEITKVLYSAQKTKIPVVTESLELQIRNYFTKSGNRAFINLNPMSAWTMLLTANKPRKTEIEWESGFIDTDTVKIAIPTGYKIEYLPTATKIYISDFGF